MGGMHIKDRPRLAPRLAGTNFPKRRNFFPVGVGEEKGGGTGGKSHSVQDANR